MKFISLALDTALYMQQRRSELQLLRNNIENLRNSVIYWKDITSDKNALEKTLNSCQQKMDQAVNNIASPSQGNWYFDYLEKKEYEKDFNKYPELREQFEEKIKRALREHQNYKKDYYDISDNLKEIRKFLKEQKGKIYIHIHPHFQDALYTLPIEYNNMLAKLRKTPPQPKNKNEWECTPEKIKPCHTKLTKILSEDNKKSLQALCGKALQEGQVCCASPNKSCGDFAFAKDITNTFAQNLPSLSQTLAQIQAMKGNTEEACKLSNLGNLVSSLGGLHLDSCNKAIDGCRDTCQAQIDQFKREVKSCYKIGTNESIEGVLEKAQAEEPDEDDSDKKDPRHKCFDQLTKLATAYKEISRDSQHALTEESNHKEIVSCYNEIAKYAPGQQNEDSALQRGMNPTTALAVNICYEKTKSKNPYAVAPAGPMALSEQNSTRSPVSFTGSVSNQSNFQTSDLNDDIDAPGEDSGKDLIEEEGLESEANELSFKPPSESKGSGDSDSSGALTGDSGIGKKEADKEFRSLAEEKQNDQMPFYTGGKKMGTGNANAWVPEDDEDKRVLKDWGRANELKKLPKKYLTDEEKDMVKMYSKIGKHESIFERASFALHWFCRNYGCYMYEELMGIPEYVRTNKEP